MGEIANTNAALISPKVFFMLEAPAFHLASQCKTISNTTETVSGRLQDFSAQHKPNLIKSTQYIFYSFWGSGVQGYGVNEKRHPQLREPLAAGSFGGDGAPAA
jgi:hypothetical protein